MEVYIHMYFNVSMPSAPVDNRDNAVGRRGGPARAYTGVHRESLEPGLHAFFTPIPRRAACAASGLGSRRAAREIAEGRAGMERAVAVQPGEDALVLRQ